MVGDGSGDVDELDALHLSLAAHAPHERRVWGGAADDEDGDAMARAAAGEGEALAQEKLRRATAAAASGWVGSAGWQALNFARLSHSTISFFDEPRPKTATSHWNRVSLKASKVGQGLSRDSKALKLAFQHWVEAIDPRHRSGHNLHFYYDFWCQSQAGHPFFYWLDVGDGKDVDLPECPRTLLKKQCIKYLGPIERELYEYIINEGKVIHKQSGEPLDTSQGPEGAKWIFVVSTARRLYAGKKEKGVFQHSSFLAGGATIAAGKFMVENGVIKVLLCSPL
ncbi:IQ domain-containing protein IQM3-like [Panicum virgatum]|uniref:IQ domain-containing protein IQM3-like n=1 Tax=Panicum virgatum TaxID=38727 RepID=UPI0019D658D7|nr:IQ domain-containing protein IQM3-like [Panicum virgatum]